MKENKNLTLTGIIYALLFVVYNVIIFMLFKELTVVFWVSYVFMGIAFAVQITSMMLSFKSTDVETIFHGIPLASLSFYYLLAELFCSFVFMLFQGAGVKAAIIIQLLLLAAFVIIAIIALMARDAVQDVNKKIKENVSFIKSINVDLEMLKEHCSDAALKECLRKLTETVKYSDPMTNASVADVEQRIMQKLSETRVYCDSAKIEDAKNACTDLELLFIERNKKLYISK